MTKKDILAMGLKKFMHLVPDPGGGGHRRKLSPEAAPSPPPPPPLVLSPGPRPHW